MANIIVKNLVGCSASKPNSGNFLQDLSENQLNIQGGYKCHVVIRIRGISTISCPTVYYPQHKPVLF